MANQRLIYGFHAVNARLWQNPKSITELYIQEGRNDARTRDVLEKAAAENVRVHFADAARLDAISKGARHQGVAGFIDASKNHVHLEDVLENLSEPPLLLPPLLLRALPVFFVMIYIFSGADTPSRPSPLASTARTESASFSRASSTGRSSPLMRQAV